MTLFSMRWAALLGAALMCGAAFAAGVPALPEGLSAPAKPTQMPAFSLPQPDGTLLRSDSLRDKVVILRFWATW